ncbi:MAG: hypothetical protein RMK29_07920 [Myxococcales bacterium]|nr:hypothetical protein [Myxococcales bacterium]
MAELEIAPLTQRLDEEEIAQLFNLLKERGIAKLPRIEGTSTTLGNQIDEDALEEFLDLLSPHEAACDIYLPLDVSGQFDIGNLRIGTTRTLLTALEELRGDLDIEDEDEEEEDEIDRDTDDMEYKLRGLWRLFQQGVEAAQQRRLPLHVYS